MTGRRAVGLLALVFAAGGVAGAETPALGVTQTELATPAGPGARAATMSTGRDGTTRLTWIERAPAGGERLMFSSYDARAGAWVAPTLIDSRPAYANGSADRPALAAGLAGNLTAAWLVDESVSAALYRRSDDGGKSWAPAQAVSSATAPVEFLTLHARDQGDVLAVWLDGRAKRTDAGAQQLFGRTVGAGEPERPIDPRVCDCCRTSLASFPDGSALVAYRGRTTDEIRDIHVARFRDGQWTDSRVVHDDGWRIQGCPVNGPQLAAAGNRAGLAWYTAAHNDPRVFVTVTPDAGARWLQPLRVDLGHPTGHVALAALADHSLLVTWIEGDGKQGGLWVRRITPDFALGAAAWLVPAAELRPGTFPQLAMVRDESSAPPECVVAFESPGTPSSLRSIRVTLPDRSTLAGRARCVPCDEADARAVRGFPLRGKVVEVWPARGAMLVEDLEIPGVMRAMTMEMRADPGLLAEARRDRRLLGRIERRGREWWLYDARWLGE